MSAGIPLAVSGIGSGEFANPASGFDFAGERSRNAVASFDTLVGLTMSRSGVAVLDVVTPVEGTTVKVETVAVGGISDPVVDQESGVTRFDAELTPVVGMDVMGRPLTGSTTRGTVELGRRTSVYDSLAYPRPAEDPITQAVASQTRGAGAGATFPAPSGPQ